MLDGYIALLSGAQGMKDVNKRVRGEPAVQKAFGRTGCAEQSVVQDTLDACTEQNVVEMKRANRRIFQAHSQSLPARLRPNLASVGSGYDRSAVWRESSPGQQRLFLQARNRCGRQEGYVIASWYEEIVAADLCRQYLLNRSLRPLMEESESCLELDQSKREQTIVRVNLGGGSSRISTGLWNAAITSIANSIRFAGLAPIG